MTITSAHKRNDPAPQPGEIEFHPGPIGQAPRRVPNSEAVKDLKEIEAEEVQFSKEVRDAQARLDAARAAAATLQQTRVNMVEQRSDLMVEIGQAEAELEISTRRIAAIETEVRSSWHVRGVHDHFVEFARREFLAARLPKWIEEFKARLTVLDRQIAEFDKIHGVGK